MSFDFVENFTVKMPDFSKLDLDFSESFNNKQGIIIEVAAIHEGLTANYNNYSASELEKALQSWVEPYPKPIILNHDLNSEPIGRVIAARMDKEADGTSFVRLQVAITDPVAAQKVSDKRYLTGSVGGRAARAICSISGEDLAKEDDSGRPRVSKYKRGKVYKGKVAYVDMQDVSFKEYSFVNLPADSKSGVRSSVKEGNDSADNWVARSSAFVLKMDEEDIISVEESESILKNMKKKESKPTYLHLKGAFLSALALHESENGIHNSDSLLSNEDSDNLNSEENYNMEDVTKDEALLEMADNLSKGLSELVAESTKVSDEETEVVTEAEASPLVSALQKTLDHAVVMYFSAHRAHWNVEGEDFYEFHAIFSQIYEDVLGSFDDIAENIRKIQAFPAGLTTMVMNASIKDDLTTADPIELATDLLAKNIVVNNVVLEAFAAATAANEQGIANFLAERDDMHKKWSWQLRSILKMEQAEPANESWFIKKSEKTEESVNEQSNVDSTETKESENDQEISDTASDLTSENSASEQGNAASQEKIESLELENKKLKSALHMALIEKVVDLKISLNLESQDDRDKLIAEHASRTAASLTDSLRDLSALPQVKKVRDIISMPEVTNESEVTSIEDNVTTIDKSEEAPRVDSPVESFEQLLVDALMGRRKL